MTSSTSAPRFDQQHDSRSIDVLRGYAILMVIGMHVIGHVPNLAWPAKRVLLLGANGVQLFFIASAVTLLMSWHRERMMPLAPRLGRFLTNRFFRIAPLYFLAILFYWLFENYQVADFSLERLVATLLFYNAWSPYLIPTVGGWKTVPGGWSISVEFMFYLAFPVFAFSVTTVRRAVLFVAVAYAVMVGAAIHGQHLYPEISSAAREHFLFFWPPNQLIVFAIGFLLYRAIKSDPVQAWVQRSRLNGGSATVLFGMSVLLIQFYPAEDWPLLNLLLPQHLLLSLCFASWALFLLLKPTAVATPQLIVNVGKMSFSIYLLHFAGLAVMDALLEKVWPLGETGIASIAYAATLLVAGAFVSYQVARLTYRFVEKPMIRYGKSIHPGGPVASPNSRPAGHQSPR